MSQEKPVNRCECINKTFAQLKQYGSLEEAVRETRAGLECGGCVPYLKLMFATGETEFAIEDARLKEHA
ncbi:MAG: hypothetical protein ACE5F3_08515 [Mariprofundaceae bacterium]